MGDNNQDASHGATDGAVNGDSTSGHCDEKDHSTFNWYYTRQEIERDSPSRADGIKLKTETWLRRSYCTYLQDLGMRLRMPQETIASAIVFCHRFYLRQSHASNDRYTIATICMFLAGKVEETPRPIKEIIITAHEIRHRRDSVAVERIKREAVFEEQKERLLAGESLVMATLGFDLIVVHPYKPLVQTLRSFGHGKDALVQVAWNFLNDGLHTSLCLQFRPRLIALGAIYLSSKFLKVNPHVGDKDWWEDFRVSLRDLEEVGHQMLELYEQNRPAATGAGSGGSTAGASARASTYSLTSAGEHGRRQPSCSPLPEAAEQSTPVLTQVDSERSERSEGPSQSPGGGATPLEPWAASASARSDSSPPSPHGEREANGWMGLHHHAGAEEEEEEEGGEQETQVSREDRHRRGRVRGEQQEEEEEEPDEEGQEHEREHEQEREQVEEEEAADDSDDDDDDDDEEDQRRTWEMLDVVDLGPARAALHVARRLRPPAPTARQSSVGEEEEEERIHAAAASEEAIPVHHRGASESPLSSPGEEEEEEEEEESQKLSSPLEAAPPVRRQLAKRQLEPSAYREAAEDGELPDCSSSGRLRASSSSDPDHVAAKDNDKDGSGHGRPASGSGNGGGDDDDDDDDNVEDRDGRRFAAADAFADGYDEAHGREKQEEEVEEEEGHRRHRNASLRAEAQASGQRRKGKRKATGSEGSGGVREGGDARGGGTAGKEGRPRQKTGRQEGGSRKRSKQ